MPGKQLPQFAKGDRLKAADLMVMRERIMRQKIQAGQNTGLSVQETPDGTILRVTWKTDRYVAFASGGVTARSGLTPGTGDAELFLYNPTTNILVDVNVNVPVKNYSGTLIGAGKYCWVEQDTNGTYWVVSAEC